MPVDRAIFFGAQEEGPENFERFMKLRQDENMVRVFQIDARYNPSCSFRTVEMPLREACKRITAWICAEELELLTMDASASNITVVVIAQKDDCFASLGKHLAS